MCVCNIISGTKDLSGDQLKKSEVDRSCSMYEGVERCVQGFGWETCVKETTWKTQAYGRIILKWIFGK
jgi:hypothetical protein